MNTSGKFYITKVNDYRVELSPVAKPQPILWCQAGQYCIISKAIVENAIDLYKSFKQTDLKRTPPQIFLMWSQGIPISNLAGRALVGE